jgi:uncharacterized phiE125 gp8 family phage protein
LEEFRLHCRVDNHDNDVLLVSAIKTATLNVEEITNRALLTQTWDYCLDSWPNKNYIRIPKGNLQSVTSIKYKDDAGTEYTLVAGTDYLVEKNGDQNGRIVLPYGKSWPSSTLYPSNPITVRYVCGWTEAMKVPYPLRTAVKMIGLDLYENGEAYICVQQPIIPNKAIDRLIASWRLWD